MHKYTFILHQLLHRSYNCLFFNTYKFLKHNGKTTSHVNSLYTVLFLTTIFSIFLYNVVLTLKITLLMARNVYFILSIYLSSYPSLPYLSKCLFTCLYINLCIHASLNFPLLRHSVLLLFSSVFPLYSCCTHICQLF